MNPRATSHKTIHDNSGTYAVAKEPNIIYGIGYREKGTSKTKSVFLTWKTQSLSSAGKIIADLKTRKVYTGIDWAEIVFVKQSMELIEIIKE